jgi:hypothetical protein
MIVRPKTRHNNIKMNYSYEAEIGPGMIMRFGIGRRLRNKFLVFNNTGKEIWIENVPGWSPEHIVSALTAFASLEITRTSQHQRMYVMELIGKPEEEIRTILADCGDLAELAELWFNSFLVLTSSVGRGDWETYYHKLRCVLTRI